MIRSTALFMSTVSTMLFMYPGRMASAMTTARVGPGPMHRYTVGFIYYHRVPGLRMVMLLRVLLRTLPGLDCWLIFSQGCASVLYQDFAPKMDLNLIYRLSDLVNCFERMCGIGVYDASSVCAHPGLFDRGLWPFSVCAILRLIMSNVMGDGDCVPVATPARSQTGGSRCFGWLQFVTQGAVPVAPPINGRERTVMLNRRDGVMYVRIVYAQQGSVTVLQVTGSLLILILVSC